MFIDLSQFKQFFTAYFLCDKLYDFSGIFTRFSIIIRLRVLNIDPQHFSVLLSWLISQKWDLFFTGAYKNRYHQFHQGLYTCFLWMFLIMRKRLLYLLFYSCYANLWINYLEYCNNSGLERPLFNINSLLFKMLNTRVKSNPLIIIKVCIYLHTSYFVHLLWNITRNTFRFPKWIVFTRETINYRSQNYDTANSSSRNCEGDKSRQWWLVKHSTFI